MIGFAREYAIDAVALRLAWVYGPGRRTPTTLAQLLQAAVDGRAFMIDDAPDGDPLMSMSRMSSRGC